MTNCCLFVCCLGNAPPPPPAPPLPPVNVPAAPPMMPPPPMGNSRPPPPMIADPRSQLLESIREGKALKPVETERRASGDDARGNLLNEIRQGTQLKPANVSLKFTCLIHNSLENEIVKNLDFLSSCLLKMCTHKIVQNIIQC